ncbi:MAG TPA: CPXCG motif-containing cysteine-rich protein [Candidatus Sulfotelmatobacter sp.]|nr:CPXCG motif-containing cysteine-rich protein [Candidatus Sulfotelmatobacter sp.]
MNPPKKPHYKSSHRRDVASNVSSTYTCCMEGGFQCASCGEWNTTSVDESAGRRQSYVEDCQVCCKPNVLRIDYDNSAQEFFIAAELE